MEKKQTEITEKIFNYDNPNAKFGIEPNEVLNLNNMEKKQTAVEWLEQAYWDNKGTLSQKHFDQAKQMEKEQIQESWYDGISGGQCGDSEQYYNETYGKTKNQITMEKKEISIYWLLDKIISKKHTDSELNYIFQQAEAMHKKEIMKVVMDFGWSKEKADKYYNETYGGTK